MEKDDAINIGGVDVSECPYLTYELEEDGFYYHFCDIAPVGCSGECRYINDCHYKQFKRIEKERDELQERLTQAEEDIKSECLTCKNLITLEQELDNEKEQSKEVSDGLLKIQYKLASNCDKYRSVLEEIKIICQDEQEICTGECGNYNVATQVLNKINEVLNED